MLAIYTLHYKIDVTIGDHGSDDIYGYCSGAENVDVDEEIAEVTEIALSKNNSKFFNYLIRMLSPEKLNLSLGLYRHLHFDASHLCECRGSGYCSPSPSGLLHDYRVNSSILKQINFSKYSECIENEILKLELDNLKKKIYNILFVLKQFNVVKDMRILIILKVLNG